MTPPDFIDTAAVAALLGLPPSGFLARRAELIADHGFPQPMPYARNPLRWRRDMVLAWLQEQGLPLAAEASLPPRQGGFKPVLIAEARKA
jgi:predicted DNA-binding transcriptional regulator AlpA